MKIIPIRKKNLKSLKYPMATASQNTPMSKADARALLRKEASFFLGQKTPEEKMLLRTASNVSFVIQEHNDEPGLADIHADIFGGLNRLKQEYISKAGTFLTSCLTKYTSLHQVTKSQMALSDLKWKEKMGQTPCRFFKQGICKNGHSCPYLHSKGKQKKRAETSKKNKQVPPAFKTTLKADSEIQQQITTLMGSVDNLSQQIREVATVTSFLKEEYCRETTQRLGIPFTVEAVENSIPTPGKDGDRGNGSFRRSNFS